MYFFKLTATYNGYREVRVYDLDSQSEIQDWQDRKRVLSGIRKNGFSGLEFHSIEITPQEFDKFLKDHDGLRAHIEGELVGVAKTGC